MPVEPPLVLNQTNCGVNSCLSPRRSARMSHMYTRGLFRARARSLAQTGKGVIACLFLYTSGVPSFSALLEMREEPACHQLVA